MLKHSRLEGRKFRRQHSIGAYILDFYCPSERLAIELDGNQHLENANQSYDLVRTSYLNGLGIRVLRFENRDIFERMHEVLDEIVCHFV